jgi:hypothetical protein
MAVVFAVFSVAILLVFTLSEGRERRLARLSQRRTEAAQAARVIRTRGADAIERLAARLASDRGRRIGLDQLLAQPDPAGAEHLDGPAER